MKQLLLISAGLFIAGFSALGQISIDNSIFPEAGDTLFTSTVIAASGVQVGAAGADQNWDFTSLTTTMVDQSIVRNASSGMASNQFPDADLLIDFLAGEGYIDVSATEFTLIGYAGFDPLGFGVPVLSDFDPGQVIRFAPMNYQDNFQSSYGFTIAVSSDGIPDTLLDQLPITPDSIRLNISADRESEIDAWGTMSLPDGNYEVLREKRTEFRNTAVEAKVGAFPWLDVTALVGDFLPIVGMDTVITYQWHNNVEKEIIASVSVNDDGTLGPVTYKAEPDVMTGIRDLADRSLEMTAYPNPAIDHVNIKLANFPHGAYTLKIFNILGVEIWRDTVDVYMNHTERIDLRQVRKGTYLYSVSDATGKTLATKRLLVLRP